jgi:peptidase M50B-like protein/type II/III secretion system protein
VNAAARRLALPLGIAALALLLWDTFVVYPFRVFVVFLHEISHGIAAVLTGGRILAMGLTFDEGGVCVTDGGSRFWTLNAGYLGSLAWGVLFLLLGARRGRARHVISLVGAFTLVVTVLYVRTPFGVLYGLVTGATLLYVASRLSAGVSEVLLAALGVVSCLYAVWDVASDVLVRSEAGSDASALAIITPIPAVLWGAAWVVASFVVLGFTLRRLAAGRALLVALLLALPALARADDTVLEIIPLRNRPASTLLPVLQPLAPPGATITGLDTRLVVRATPRALAEIRKAVAALDTPLRSLLITVDQGRQRAASTRDAGVAGVVTSGGTTVVAGTRPSGGGAVVEQRTNRTVVTGGFASTDTTETGSDVERIRALEGSPAFIRLGRAVVAPELTVVQTTRGPAVAEADFWREAGAGFQVVPRVAGDLVTLEILTEAEHVDDRGAGEGTRAATTVSVRLGEWIDLGGALHEAYARRANALGSRHERSSEDRSIRVMVEEVR